MAAGLSLGAFGELIWKPIKLAKDKKFKAWAQGFEEFLDKWENPKTFLKFCGSLGVLCHMCQMQVEFRRAANRPRLLLKGKAPATWISVDIGFSAGPSGKVAGGGVGTGIGLSCGMSSCVAYLAVGVMATVNIPFLSPVSQTGSQKLDCKVRIQNKDVFR